MKKSLISITVALLLSLILVSGCGHRVDDLVIGEDGYGQAVLPNGIKVLVNHDETTSLTAARVLIGGGVLSETEETNGLTNLTIRMLLKGNQEMSAEEITERLDFLGANISAECYRDYSAISLSCMTQYFDEVLDIVSLSLLSPTFPEEELEKLKHEVEGNIKAADDNQSTASSNLFWRTAYGPRAYGLQTDGTIEALAGITADDIAEHYRNYVGGGNITFSVATDLPAERVMAIVRNRLGEIKTEHEPLTGPTGEMQPAGQGYREFDRNQSFIYMGNTFGHLEPRDVVRLALVNQVMGSGVGSRLWFLRQKEKLAYAVYTQYTIDKFGAGFRAAIGTDTSKVKTALASLEREWSKLVDEGITAEELQDARVNLKNNMIYRIDRKSNRANNMAYYDFVGYNYRFVLDIIDMADQVTLEEVNAFVKEKFLPERTYTSIVGKN